MPERPREVLDEALKLQAERDRDRHDAAERDAWRKAAVEVGLDDDLYDRAAAVVAARQAADAAARTRRRAIAVGALVAVGVAAAGLALLPDPAPPWSDDLTGGAARWSLDASAGTQASLAWEGDAAVLRVERAAPRDDGTWFVNLDTTLPVPTLADYGEVSFRVQGEGLGHVRVYLESADERWRSPPVPVTPSDTLHTVPFDAFEHQLREDGRWRVVGWTHPGRVPTLSFKVGHYVNPPEQAGSVRLDDVGLR